MKNIRYLDNVSSLVFDQEKCVGCGLCEQVCPHYVFNMKDKKAQLSDPNACMECGACVNNCFSNAISVKPGVG